MWPKKCIRWVEAFKNFQAIGEPFLARGQFLSCSPWHRKCEVHQYERFGYHLWENTWAQAIYASNARSDVKYHCNVDASTCLTQKWNAKNSLSDNRKLLAQHRRSICGEIPKQCLNPSKTWQTRFRKVETRPHCPFPQECKETELLSLENPFRKFQQMTSPLPSRH